MLKLLLMRCLTAVFPFSVYCDRISTGRERRASCHYHPGLGVYGAVDGVYGAELLWLFFTLMMVAYTLHEGLDSQVHVKKAMLRANRSGVHRSRSLGSPLTI